MLPSNVGLEVTFKCLDHNFYEKGGKKISTAGGILGHQQFPVFPEYCIVLTPLC